mmetsp:Transcript_129766/g.361521  ORF Transcript_129766/g.361521 Transcript_129766/m.361521 type:complete len:254 (-) Transcript_129766:722-1483(-)
MSKLGTPRMLAFTEGRSQELCHAGEQNWASQELHEFAVRSRVDLRLVTDQEDLPECQPFEGPHAICHVLSAEVVKAPVNRAETLLRQERGVRTKGQQDISHCRVVVEGCQTQRRPAMCFPREPIRQSASLEEGVHTASPTHLCGIMQWRPAHPSLFPRVCQFSTICCHVQEQAANMSTAKLRSVEQGRPAELIHVVHGGSAGLHQPLNPGDISSLRALKDVGSLNANNFGNVHGPQRGKLPRFGQAAGESRSE